MPTRQNPTRHVVVDGSNIGTEGRSSPSLKQLDEAVREFLGEFPDSNVTVVVDATFGHRIDSSEQKSFEEARSAGELVSPPAGAIGRGDAFLLRIADKVGAMVLSNDSFQEFHGDYEWLFDADRLIGGVPVPGVGWIFTPRSPVRGPASRVAVQKAKKARKPAEPVKVKKAVKVAIDVATEEAEEPAKKSRSRRRSRGTGAPPAEPVNEPLAFIDFVSAHPLGSKVEAEVEGFTSHGAFMSADGLRCYLPLTGMGEPPPRSARSLLNRGDRREVVIQAYDPPRRGVEVALPEYAHVAGAPTAETVEAEIATSSEKPKAKRAKKAAMSDEPKKAAKKSAKGAKKAAVAAVAADADAEPPAKPKKKRASKKDAAAKKDAPPAEDLQVEKAPPAKKTRTSAKSRTGVKKAAKKAAPAS
jgi:hypothetical protein